ncbi:MAG: hypothetical protein ACF8NJ_09250 [Phycisphaerales bacterium JB038]
MPMRLSLARPRRTAPLVAALVTAGCGGDGSSAPDDAVPEVELSAPDLRFGSLDGPDALVPVGPVALAEDGSLWVVQAQDFEVVALEPSGAVRARVGGAGEGPGEFGAVSDLGWAHDTLWVSDSRNRRLTFYAADGTFLGTEPLPAPATEQPPTSAFLGLLSDGALFVEGPTTEVLMNPEGATSGAFPIWTTPRGGGPPRAVARSSGAFSRVVIAETSGGEIRSIAIFRQPWNDGSLVAVRPGGDGLVVVDRPVAGPDGPAEYRVTRIGPSGDTAWSTTRGFTPLPVDRAHRDSVIAAWAANGTSEDALRARLFLPATLPPASSVFVGRDDRVWVGRERPRGVAGGRWDVFSFDGSLEFELTAPAAVELRAADARAVWGVETDDLDVPYLVRCPLR